MPLDARHLRQHLDDLIGRTAFLRPLQPDNPSYRLWLGDVIELVNVQWGVGSVQMQRLRAAIGRGGRHPDGDSSEDRTRAYRTRLDDIEAVLTSFTRAIGEPLTFFDTERGDP